MVFRVIAFGLLALSIGLADTLTLRNGKVVQGTFLGGDARQIRMAVGERVESYDISDISTLQFGTAPKPAAAAPSAPAQAQTRVLRPDTPPPAAAAEPVELAAGTHLVVRMIDEVDSERHQVGQTFRASLDEPVVVDGRTVMARGVDALVKLVEDKQSGRLSGRTELTLDLVSVNVNGKPIEVKTQEVTTASESRTGQTAKRVGGLAAAGAVIGAIAGGGKGAAIGAATGAGAGTAIQIMTKGQKVQIPSETRLQFTLQSPLRL